MSRTLRRFLPLLAAFMALPIAGCTVATPTQSVPPTTVPTLVSTRTATTSPTATAEPTTPPTLTPAPSRTATLHPTVAPTLKTIAYGAIARQHLQALAETIGARVAGSAKEAQAAQYISTTLATKPNCKCSQSQRGSIEPRLVSILPM